MIQRTSGQDHNPASDLPGKITQLCQSIEVSDRVDSLVCALQALLPDYPLRHAMTRGGWHRLGGVVGLDGERITHNITEWAEVESGGDMDEFMFKLSDMRAFATRVNGQTHYIVAQTGPSARDFIQIEIEQLQEVLERCITDPNWYPDTIAEFVDPIDFPRLEPEPVGAPQLVFRRAVQIGDFLASEDADSGLSRFFADWDRSSAAESDGFCHHWVLAFREYRDQDGGGHKHAKLLPCLDVPLPELLAQEAVRGARLANQIHGFDRQAGYPFAWYFHMLTQPQAFHALAEAVHMDLMGAYDYLPARDLKVLRDWHQDPYAV